MANGAVALEFSNDGCGVEIIPHQAKGAVMTESAIVAGQNTCRLLPAMLQGMKAEGGVGGSVA
jgi:hypothetical protein